MTDGAAWSRCVGPLLAWATLMAWVTLLAPSVAQAGEESRLLRAFAEMSGFEAKFREEKTIALLAAPLVNEGTVHFDRSGLFARHVIKPERSSLLIEDGVLSLGTQGKVRAHRCEDATPAQSVRQRLRRPDARR